MNSPDARPVFMEKRSPDNLTSFDSSQAEITPLKSLARWPRRIHCPECRQMSVTRVARKISSGTHFIASLFFLFSIIGVAYPYAAKTYKDVEHRCCRCGCKVATFHVMSGTEVHVF